MLNVDFNNIDNLIAAKTSAQVARAGLYVTAGCIVGRKVGQLGIGLGYKAGSTVANFFENRGTARRLDKQGDSYIAAAKNNLVRDLTIAATAMGTGYALEQLEDSFTLPIADLKADQSYDVRANLNNAWNFITTKASNVNTYVRGDQRFPLQKAQDLVAAKATVAKDYLLNDFRLTTPVKPTFFRNVAGQIGPESRKKIGEVVSETIDIGGTLLGKIGKGLVSGGTEFVQGTVSFVGTGLSQLKTGVSPVTDPIYDAGVAFVARAGEVKTAAVASAYKNKDHLIYNVTKPAFNSFNANYLTPAGDAFKNKIVTPVLDAGQTVVDNKEGATLLIAPTVYVAHKVVSVVAPVVRFIRAFAGF